VEDYFDLYGVEPVSTEPATERVPSPVPVIEEDPSGGAAEQIVAAVNVEEGELELDIGSFMDFDVPLKG
jgi:hypothetical protein